MMVIKAWMETSRVLDSLGFFLSVLVTLSLAVLSIDLLQLNAAQLPTFVLILPVFTGSIILRTLTWKKVYSASHKTLHLFTAIFVLVFGLSLLVGFIYYASSQLALASLENYSGLASISTLPIIILSLLWLTYSLFEFSSLYSLFKNKILRLVRFSIVPIALTESAIVFFDGYSGYLLPIGLVLLSITTFIAALGFLFD